MSVHNTIRSAAESNGNHCSNDVLAANIAKTIFFGNGLVSPEFVSKVAHDIHPDDAALLRDRVYEHLYDLRTNVMYCHIFSSLSDAREKVEEFLSGVSVSEKAKKGAFLSPADCPNDRGLFFRTENGRIFKCNTINIGECTKIKPGEKYQLLDWPRDNPFWNLYSTIERKFGKKGVKSL